MCSRCCLTVFDIDGVMNEHSKVEIFDVKNNLIAIANNFVNVRDITLAKRGHGFYPSTKRLARPEHRCFETSDVVTEWLPSYNAWDI